LTVVGRAEILKSGEKVQNIHTGVRRYGPSL